MGGNFARIKWQLSSEWVATLGRNLHIIELNLPSYRLEEARRKKGGDENKSEKPE